jgi:Fe-S oxidoreductase
MFFLNASDPRTINVVRKLMIDWGYRAQRLGNRFFRLAARAQVQHPPATVGRAPLREEVIHFVNKKMPGNLPKKTARALLDLEDSTVVPIIRDPKRTTSETEAVFYFPGCGSERLFSQVGLATQAMLWHVGVQTVLPPGYLCCGYPQRGSGDFEKAEKIITDNRVLFHRVANTLNYLDIKSVAAPAMTSCRVMNLIAYSRAAVSLIFMNIYLKKASSWNKSPEYGTCTMILAIRR